MGKKGFLSESDAIQILRRYSAVTVMGLLREIARCENSKLDWNALVKKSSTGISSAREYQALWRHLAYRAELADCYDNNAEPSEDESDLEFELVPTPVDNAEATAEAVRWVKADLQRFDTSGKRKAEVQFKSKVKDAVLPLISAQIRISGVSDSTMDATFKDASMATSVPAEKSSPASPPSEVQIPAAPPECPPSSLSRIGLGHSERKKRKLWSPEEDQELIAAVEKFGEGNWTNILKDDFTHERTAAQLSQRWALIRKRRDIHALLGKAPPATVSQGVQTLLKKPSTGFVSPGAADVQRTPTPPADTVLQSNTNTVQNAGNNAILRSNLLLSADVGNGSVNHDALPGTAMGSVTSSSGTQSIKAHVSNLSGSSQGGMVNNGAIKSSLPMVSANGAVCQQGGTSARAGANKAQRNAHVVAGTRSTTGSSTPPIATGQVSTGGANSATAGTGAGRLIAPGALVMSAAAAQAASVGGSEMWNTSTAGVPTSGPAKHTSRNSGGAGIRGMSMKPLTGPDPGVQAAAVAAGARIAPASAVASMLKAAQSANVVHVGPGGVPSKSGLSSQTVGHNGNVGSRGSSGGIVHYICTGSGVSTPAVQGLSPSGQRPVQQPKNQSTKPLNGNQTTVCVPKSMTCPPSNVCTISAPLISQTK